MSSQKIALFLGLFVVFGGLITSVAFYKNNQQEKSKSTSAQNNQQSTTKTQSSIVTTSPPSKPPINSEIKQSILYYTGTLGDKTPISLKIYKDPKSDSWLGKYIYTQTGSEAIDLKGEYKNSNFVMAENQNTILSINPESKSGTWKDSKNTYPIKLIESTPDIVEKELLYKKTTTSLTTDANQKISLDCQLETKFHIGNCNIINQDKKVLANFDNFGNTIVKPPTGNLTTIISYFSGYGTCSYRERVFDSATNSIKLTKEILQNCQSQELLAVTENL
jgi:hypothetical protein